MEREYEPNNLFFFSEMLSAQALKKVLPDNSDPLDSLLHELFDVAIWFAEASDGIMELILQNFGQEIQEDEPVEIEFESLLDLRDVFIPWFTDTSKILSDKFE